MNIFWSNSYGHQSSHTVTLLALALLFNAGFDPAIAGCPKSKSSTAAVSHFTLQGEEAYDRRTHLTWARCSVGKRWHDSHHQCTGSVMLLSPDEATAYAQKLGHGWRLPNIDELASIIEQNCGEPAINTTIFPDVRYISEGSPYWSESKYEDMPALRYYVDFMSGAIDARSDGVSAAVRLVRTGK